MTPQQQKFMELSLETSKNTLTALKLANEQGAIADTIWLSKYETLFDYLESQIDAMQRILAQPEQEPVAFSCLRCVTPKKCAIHGCSPNTWPSEDPPQRKPLTEEEIYDAVRESDIDWHQGWTLDDEEPNRFTKFARAIEAAHGIKGEA